MTDSKQYKKDTQYAVGFTSFVCAVILFVCATQEIRAALGGEKTASEYPASMACLLFAVAILGVYAGCDSFTSKKPDSSSTPDTHRE